MSERTGLDSVVLAVLDGLDEMGARPDGRPKKSATVVDHVRQPAGSRRGSATTRSARPRLRGSRTCR